MGTTDTDAKSESGSNGDITIEVIDAFAQVNTALIDHGCLKKPLDVNELSSPTKKVLADLLYSMLAQRQEDGNMREQLASRVKVTESSLERTKRFWKEEKEKTADLSRRLEASKARVSTTAQELHECQSNLKRAKDELQKSKRDVLNIKQHAHQQKQANERQIERLRSKFSDESIKSLRSKVAEVYVANVKEISTASLRRSASTPSSLERKQIDDLESKRKDLIEANSALKRFATESLNLAREAGHYLDRLEQDHRQFEVERASLLSSAGSFSSDRTIHQRRTPAIHYQRDLFPPLYPLRSDYSTGAKRGQKQHPAVEAMGELSEAIHGKGVMLLESLVTQRASYRAREQDVDTAATEIASHHPAGIGKVTQEEERSRRDAEREKLLSRALQEVEDLEAEIERRERDSATLQNRKEDREERFAQAAEVERQRQRYLSLCRELEKQEESLRKERESLQREKEEVMKMELSLSITEDQEENGEDDSSLPSFSVGDLTDTTPSLKRARDDEKENVPAKAQYGKRSRVEQQQQRTSTPKGDTMRFVTMRKSRVTKTH
ncbi:hypothetical protein CBS101457_005202 [Exobasidium rhododendri]|nr:hypothetical protein CBS101457_005202 [Exobasidium rhododendri]